MTLGSLAYWTLVGAGGAAVLAAVAGLLASLIDGGPVCPSCGFTSNQCSEAWHFSGRGCCSSCSHEAPAELNPAAHQKRDGAEYEQYLRGPIDPRD